LKGEPGERKEKTKKREKLQSELELLVLVLQYRYRMFFAAQELKPLWLFFFSFRDAFPAFDKHWSRYGLGIVASHRALASGVTVGYYPQVLSTMANLFLSFLLLHTFHSSL